MILMIEKATKKKLIKKNFIKINKQFKDKIRVKLELIMTKI